MPILVRNLRCDLDASDESLLQRLAKRLKVPVDVIHTYAVVRRSLDARRRDDIHFSYQIELDLNERDDAQQRRVKRLNRNDVLWYEPDAAAPIVTGRQPLRHRPVVVGFGPAGMFAALRLAEYGYAPIVLERGREVRQRHRDIMQRFYRDREFDPTSNLLFGEGGAGTYSDGKLYTRIHDPRCREVLEVFYRHGADPDILVDTRPHIGSDRLPAICTRIRQKIESLGGEIRFECHVDDIDITDERVNRLHVRDTRSGAAEWHDVGPVLLAVGHSARDTIRMLSARGVRIDPKPFQIGVRIEHPQAMVDGWRYGRASKHQRLGPAEYHLIAKRAAGPHGDLFSFCMCPGGMILPTNESEGLIATNGASRARRSGPFANSGLVISLQPADVVPPGAPSPAISALDYLESWERKAFELTGRSYAVPAQRTSDFLTGRSSTGDLQTSYPLGGRWTDITQLVPESVSLALKKALPMLNEQFPGIAGDEGLITAPETRASAPVRIVRDPETRQAFEISDLYPAGEGAGYAGGIVSAAVDGLKSAEAVIHHYAPVR